jgi:hypothetical protein
MREQKMLTTIAGDKDFQVEEFSRNPYSMLISHSQSDGIPSGIEMLANRNSLEVEEVSDYGGEYNEIENYNRIRITE